MPGITTISADIPPGPPPTQSGVPETTTARPSTAPLSASDSWSGAGIAVAVVLVFAFVAAIVAISFVIARRA